MYYRAVTSVRIPATFFDTVLQERKDASATFVLGEGRCGKTVSSLEVEVKDGFVEVSQDHTDGTTKTFLYRVDDLIGRIEVEQDPSVRLCPPQE